MGLFGSKKPKLPSYIGTGLDALLQDPAWADAITLAGIDPPSCEIVLRLADPKVGTGGGSAPESARPAILFGQGSTLAIAFPSEREVRVVKRDTATAELQTVKAGWFQMLFGPAASLDGFMFWGREDNLQLGTPEGETFGKIMSAFLEGHLKPQQIVGTPQSLASSGVSVEPPAPAFQDPDDALRWRMLHSARTSLADMMDKYQQCFEKADLVEKAFNMANAEYVDGVRQHEISRDHFRNVGVRYEQELVSLLVDLREATGAAQAQWKDLVFLFPDGDNPFLAISDWCMAHDVDPGVSSSVLGNGVFIGTNFGLTRESFWTENERIVSRLEGNGQ
jgi:hypothetical protein